MSNLHASSASGINELTSGENISFWTTTADPMVFQSIDQELETEVLIIGGGISGLTTAYCLTEAGKKVILVEDGFLGSGESGRTTAHITYALDDRYYEIERIFGKKKARLAANSHASAIEFINHTVKLHSIDCNFRRVDGYLFLSPTDNKDSLEKEYHSTHKLGLLTEMLKEIPYIKAEEGEWCIKFPDQAQFHVLKYLQGLSNYIVDKGNKIYTQSKATEITKDGATVNGHKIKADHIVVATNSPVNDWATMHTKQWPYRTYVIGAKVKKGTYPYSLWWDTGNKDSKWISEPYHYVRLTEMDNHYDLLIAGGEDHKTGQSDNEHLKEEDRYHRLEEWTKKRFPAIEKVTYKWSGQVMEPVDALAFIGKNPGDDNIYIITGDSGNGITHGTIGGMLVSDLIMGRKNELAELYDPSRITLNTAKDYVHEAANMAAQYADWLSSGDIKTVEELKPGQGGILSASLKKTAVYRDEDSQLHAFTAVCPHMGCIVQWNNDEKSFDCPCHGSRFTKEGIVINGPAVNDLQKVNLKKEG